MISRLTYLLLFATVCGSSLISCGSKAAEQYDKQLDTLEIMLRHADENLALDPEQIQLRIDTMGAKLLLIDSLLPGLSQKGNEVAMAYNIYRGAKVVFERYVATFDGLLFENQTLVKELSDLRKGLKEKSGAELEALQKSIPEFKKRCYANYIATKELIRSYLDIIRPYQRKKKIIGHMFTQLVENNYKPEE